ncbi:MAG: ankyrin repeat domain-containing protein [Chthoniobacteraceae bacterium]|jgi:ankyrin repeat protein
MEHGVNSIADHVSGKTPLMLAVEAGDEEVVLYLLAHGVDTTLKDNDCETALDIAKKAPSLRIEQILELDSSLNPPASEYYSGKRPRIAIVTGPNQIATPGRIFDRPLLVSVTDERGKPLSNAPVRIAVGGGEGT